MANDAGGYAHNRYYVKRLAFGSTGSKTALSTARLTTTQGPILQALPGWVRHVPRNTSHGNIGSTSSPRSGGGFLFNLKLRIKNLKLLQTDRLLIPLMAEQAPVFGGMVFGQRGDALGRMAFLAEFFRRLFVHCQEFCMVFIIGQVLGSLFRGVPEEEEKATADNDKNDVVEQDVLAFFVFFFGIH